MNGANVKIMKFPFVRIKYLLKEEIKLYFKVVNSYDIIWLWNVHAFTMAVIKCDDPYSVYK
jgi:hypothetical protein